MTCFVCEDYAVVCRLCKLPGTRCNHGRKYKPVNCPACAAAAETPSERTMRVHVVGPRFFSIALGRLVRLVRWSFGDLNELRLTSKFSLIRKS
jgi:hypothetical protein